MKLPDLSAVPAELRGLPRWVRWKSVPADPKPRKVPIRPDSPRCASSTDPATWGSFETALAHVGKHGTCGLGFVFARDGFVGIDLDECLTEEGSLETRAADLLAKFQTYTEESPSGTGLHLIARGSLNGHRGINAKGRTGIEVYDAARFFTVTGKPIPGAPLVVASCQAALDSLLAELRLNKESTPSQLHRREKPPDVFERAKAYVSKMPAAVSGQGGHEATWRVALALVKGFGLGTGPALDLLREFNVRCEPPWSENELLHKLEDAGKADVPDGYIVDRDPPRTLTASPAWRGRITQADDRKAAVHLVSAMVLATMEFPEPRWAVPGLIPEGLSILAGRPKLGKSFLALNLGIAVASGRSFLGQFAAPGGDAVYFALEDTPRRLQRRLRMMFPESISWPAGLFLSTELPRIDQGGLTEIERILDEHSSCRFVGLDTMARVRTPKKRGADVYQEDADFIATLQRKALDRRFALLLVHHTRKAKTEDVLDDVAGTTGLTGSADTILVLTRARGADEAILHVTGRDVEERELALKFDRERGSWAFIGDAEEVQLSRERRELLEAARRLAPARTKDLADALGWKYDRTRKLIYRCCQDGLLREGMRHGTYVPATYSDMTEGDIRR